MAAAPAGAHASDDERAELLRLFGDWHHPVPEILAAADPDRLPRTTAPVRKAARTGALTLVSARPAVALRDTLVRTASRLGPGFVLRGFDGIADRRPPTAPDSARVS
ncbi:hypothetical protein ACI2LJ_22190 [Streptomyces sp. NPDC088090]|uniref:hypothetical protein n=1 Tax=Streptomyces sp. NPDC088090 TaxID=3365822 RepID=UPI00384DFB31